MDTTNKELRQIRAILGKLLAATVIPPADVQPQPCKPRRADINRKNVTRLTNAALSHMDRGNNGIARQMLLLLQYEEGEG